MAAIINNHEAAAEALIAPVASAGALKDEDALDVQVGARGRGGLSGCMWVVMLRWEGAGMEAWA